MDARLISKFSLGNLSPPVNLLFKNVIQMVYNQGKP